MTWFAFQGDGHVYNLRGLDEKQLAATGAQGYADEQTAIQNPNATANGAQAGMLAQFIVESKIPFIGGLGGVIAIDQVSAAPTTGNQAKTAQQAQQEIQSQQQQGSGSNPFDALSGIAGALLSIYREITNVHMWQSLGWGLLGAVLLLSGVAAWGHLPVPMVIPV
jgi:hypothetical protein